MRRTEDDAAIPTGQPVRRHRGSRPGVRRLGAVGIGVAVMLGGCGLHVSKSGVSGNIFGHSFSMAKGSLPAGFPSAVPTPDGSRVLGGGGADNRWTAVFAVTGEISSGTAAYQSKLSAAGYAITDIHSGTTPVTAATGSGSTATTLTVTGVSFQARDPQWTVQVLSGNTSSIRGAVLRTGEFAMDLVVAPTSTSATSSP